MLGLARDFDRGRVAIPAKADCVIALVPTQVSFRLPANSRSPAPGHRGLQLTENHHEPVQAATITGTWYDLSSAHLGCVATVGGVDHEVKIIPAREVSYALPCLRLKSRDLGFARRFVASFRCERVFASPPCRVEPG